LAFWFLEKNKKKTRKYNKEKKGHWTLKGFNSIDHFKQYWHFYNIVFLLWTWDVFLFTYICCISLSPWLNLFFGCDYK
jgi:hypothetical protein